MKKSVTLAPVAASLVWAFRGESDVVFVAPVDCGVGVSLEMDNRCFCDSSRRPQSPLYKPQVVSSVLKLTT